MDSLDAFLAELDRRRNAGEPLVSPAETVPAAVLTHPLLIAALARARDTVFRPGETGLLWEGGKNVEIRRTGDWRVLLMQRADPPEYLKTAPQLSLYALLDGDASARLRRYRIDGDVGLAASRPASRLVQVDEAPMEVGRLVACGSPAEVLDVDAGGAPTITLCLQGPRLAPYQHAYRRADLAYAFTAMADEDITGRNFFVDLVKRVTADPGFASALSAGERADIAGFMGRAAMDADQPASTRWLAVQTVARMDKVRTGELLTALRDDADPALSAQARRVAAA